MVGVPTPKDGSSKVGIKASIKSFGRSKSPPLLQGIFIEWYWIMGFLTFFGVIGYLLVGNAVHSHVTHRRQRFSNANIQQFNDNNKAFVSLNFRLNTSKLPDNPEYLPTLTNGFIGVRLFGSTIFVSGMYNGKGGESHRARLQSTLPYFGLHNSRALKNCNFELNMHGSVFLLDCEGNKDIKVQQRFFAHAQYHQLLITELSVKTQQVGNWSIPLYNSSGILSSDINIIQRFQIYFNKALCVCYEHSKAHYASCSQCQYITQAVYLHVCTKVPETEYSVTSELHVIYTQYPRALVGRDNFQGKFVFVTAIGHSREEAEYYYKEAIKMNVKLLPMHKEKWFSRWGRSGANLIAPGHLHLNQLLTSSIYYLLSSFPESNPSVYQKEFYGVSPGGLGNGGNGQDYFGHVFWDQDFWIMPSLLPFYPELVKLVLQYRVARLPSACIKAKAFGYEGAMFPWETAFTGYDVCPGPNYVQDEIHITADIIHLLQQYVYATDDWDIFHEIVPALSPNGSFLGCTATPHPPTYNCEACTLTTCLTAWDLVKYTAAFWQSRVRFEQSRGGYIIDYVMGPDEWNAPVNNSAFTNVIAASNLAFSARVADRLNACPLLSKKWKHIATNIVVSLDSAKRYHPEFHGFDPKKTDVKQADTIMLGFPLNYPMSDEVRLNDLLVYWNATTTRGPAMTWSMFSVNFLHLNHDSFAAETYLRQFGNVQAPFMVWSENSDGSGATNFLTGIGGYLQSVIYGYLGLRFLSDKLVFNPKLLPLMAGGTAKSMLIDRLAYRGFVIRVMVSSELRVIVLTSSSPDYCLLISRLAYKVAGKLCSPKDSIELQLTNWDLSVVSNR